MVINLLINLLIKLGVVKKRLKRLKNVENVEYVEIKELGVINPGGWLAAAAVCTFNMKPNRVEWSRVE